jgi:hypothetical protein
MDSITFIRILEDADLTPFDYSGRGMYGKRCIAVQTSKKLHVFLLDVIESVNDASPDDLPELFDVLRGMVSDNLGHDTIVYFPRVAFPGAE